MINIELTNSNSRMIIDINRYNYLLLINNEGYINFYNYFYELLIKKNKDYSIRLSNKNLDSRNTIMFDFTSVNNILSSLEFKKALYYMNI